MHKRKSKSLKGLERHFAEKKEYPPNKYGETEVVEDKNEQFYPPYDGERDDYEEGEEINEVSPWKIESDDACEASERSESEACNGRKGQVKRVPEALKRMPKEDRKKMAIAVISTKMRKRKSM